MGSFASAFMGVGVVEACLRIGFSAPLHTRPSFGNVSQGSPLFSMCRASIGGAPNAECLLKLAFLQWSVLGCSPLSSLYISRLTESYSSSFFVFLGGNFISIVRTISFFCFLFMRSLRKSQLASQQHVLKTDMSHSLPHPERLRNA